MPVTGVLTAIARNQSRLMAWLLTQPLERALQPALNPDCGSCVVTGTQVGYFNIKVLGVFTRAGVTGRLQCRDKILNESEPLTGKRYLSFPGIAIRRKYLEERGDVSVCCRLFLFLTDVCHGLISASAFVDVKSTAHPTGRPCSLSPPDWQNRFVEFEVSTFFVVVFFCFSLTAVL